MKCLKKIFERQKSNYFLIANYLENIDLNFLNEREYLFRLSQFLIFIQKFKGNQTIYHRSGVLFYHIYSI